jgi:hypothetical protein
MRNLLIKLLTCLCLTCGPSSTSQTIFTSGHGTIVVVFLENDKIVAGGDSFENRDNVGTNVHRCKISKLSDEAFFVAAGDVSLTSHETTGVLIPIFDAHEVAKGAFGKFRNEKSDIRMLKMANYWTTTIKGKIQAAIHSHPETPLPLKTIQGAFIGKSGTKWSLYVVEIDVIRAKTKNTPPVVKCSVTPWQPNPTSNMVLFGSGTQFVAEFVANQTPRAIAAQRQAAAIKNGPGVDNSAVTVEAAIAAAEAWAPPEYGLGGPIDILELPLKGTAKWWKVKDECNH